MADETKVTDVQNGANAPSELLPETVDVNVPPAATGPVPTTEDADVPMTDAAQAGDVRLGVSRSSLYLDHPRPCLPRRMTDFIFTYQVEDNAPTGPSNTLIPASAAPATPIPISAAAGLSSTAGTPSRAASAMPADGPAAMDATPLPAEAADHGAPVRQWLNTNIVPTLLEGMKVITREK
jgi:hypothetical protein